MTEEKQTNEQLREVWTTAVADANQLVDMLGEAMSADEPDDDLIRELNENVDKAQELADTAYQTYIKATANWVTEAPWRFDAIMVSSVVQNPETETIAPAVTFAFRGRDVEPITISLVMSELNLRKFQKDVSKQIDQSIKKCRELARG